MDELIGISDKGFPKLNVAPNLIISRFFATHSNGSPHLMQEFCKQLCKHLGIRRTVKDTYVLDPNPSYKFILRDVAIDHGKIIFDKLAQGPVETSTPLQVTLESGKQIDIYKAVLIILSNLRPKQFTIGLDQLRGMLSTILRGEPPEMDEIAWVVQQMANVKSADNSSVSIIDYERDVKKLHITDPFFAFFLKWGQNLIEEWPNGPERLE